MKGKRINLGSGYDARPDFVNVDYHALPGVAVRADALHLPFATASFSGAIALDVVEHVSWRKVTDLLAELARILAPGAQAEIRVPELDALLDLRQSGKLTDQQYVRRIFGDQGRPGDFHLAGFTEPLFLEHLARVNLKVEKTWKQNGNLTALCRK